jgi:predicted nucleic-acid-binding protein
MSTLLRILASAFGQETVAGGTAAWPSRQATAGHNRTVRNLIIEAISGLLDATDVRFEDEPAIEEALFIWRDTTADFADCLIGTQNRRLGCRATATFDVKASKLPGVIAA